MTCRRIVRYWLNQASSNEGRFEVEEPQNSYTTPRVSEKLISPEKRGPGVRKVFSPAQGSFGTLLGGPLAGIYFVCMNFLALGNKKRAWLATICGAVIAAAITFWHLVWGGDAMPKYRIIVFAAPAVIAWLIIARAQFTKAQIGASSTLAFHSNCWVAGVVLLGRVIFAALGLALGLAIGPHRG